MKKISCTGIAIFFFVSVYPQSVNWQLKDIAIDSVFGVSVDKAYQQLLPHKKPVPIIVAIVDPTAIDVSHEDLQSAIWNNEGEIPGNGIDDDHNGFIDDVHGWNFTGSEKDSAWMKGMTIAKKAFYDSLSYTPVPGIYKDAYRAYSEMLRIYKKQMKIAQEMVELISAFQRKPDSLHQFIEMPKLQVMLAYFKQQSVFRFDQQDGSRAGTSEFYENVEWVKKWIDNKNLFDEFAGHSTHIAGIMGATRSNGKGINGIADDIRIMSLQIPAEGDDWEKAIATAIRYAADKGARIINLSINLNYGGSNSQSEVEDAIGYALSKDILFIHAAGNQGHELTDPFPTNKSWMEVGASGWRDDSTLAAAFSNYGKTSVDVFAPGAQIYSTMPANHYEKHGGTSMAAPVVSGIAALIREYYPELTALQVKGIIMQSVVKRNILKDKCISGGVVNAYNALKLAATNKK
jgi:subtilisin family serine protease